MRKYHYKISVCMLALAFMLSGAGCGKNQAPPPKKEVVKEQTQEQTRELTQEQRRKARQNELTEEQKKEGAYVDKDGWI